MATQLQLRRGTTAENNAFTGAVGELTMDTDTNGLRIHDGSTVGGFDVPTADTADYVVEWQAPTDLNNYTWYRKYKSGWVEQGGAMTFPVAGASMATKTITFPIAMANTNYTAQPTPIWAQPDAYYGWALQSKTTTSMTYNGYNTTQASNLSWFVCGMAA